MMVDCVEHRSHLFFCGAHDLLHVHVGWNARIDFLRAAVAALADRSGGHQPEHVEVGNQA